MYRRWLYGSCWYKLSLANVDCLSLIMHTPWWLSCWVNTEQNSNRKERKQRQAESSLCFVTHQILGAWGSHLLHVKSFLCCLMVTECSYSLSSRLKRWLTSHKTVGSFPEILFNQVELSTWLKNIWIYSTVGKEPAPSSGVSHKKRVKLILR